MKEIAELKKEIREQIEKERKYVNFEDTQAYKDYGKAVFIMVPGVVLCLLALGMIVFPGPGDKDFERTIGFLLLPSAFFIILPFLSHSSQKKEVYSIKNEKDAVNKLREIINDESKAIKALKKDRGAVINKRTINRWKVLLNYDLDSLTSYPNKFGSNINWSEYSELQQKNLICDNNVRVAIKKKAEELNNS